MDKLSSLMVLLSLVTTNIYIADSYTLTASVLNQLGYNTQSTIIKINNSNIDKIDLNSFNGYDNLHELTIGNGIRTLDVHAFERLSNLLVLDLRFNLLTSLEYLQIPKNLDILFLDSNNLNYFSLPRTMDELQVLGLSNNRFRSFKSINFSLLPNLRQLHLKNNPLAYPNEMSGHLKPLVNLDYVDFTNLSISCIDSNFFKTNTKLNLINLSQNKIKCLDSAAFNGLNDLDTVFIAQNNLTEIASGTFANLPKLRHVNLNNNQITQLDSSVFSGSNNLIGIYLWNNPDLSTTNIQSLCPPAATQCKVYY